MEEVREVQNIWAAETARALRSVRGIVLLGLYFFFSAVVLLVVGWITQAGSAQLSAQGVSPDQMGEVAVKAKQALLAGLFGADQELVEALGQLPLVIPIVFKVTLFFLPAYVVLMGFDQISGEIEPRSIRYLAIRARRSSILIGKYLSQATVLTGLILIVDALIFAYARLISPEFGAAVLFPALLRFWIAGAVFSFSYVALTTLCSSLFSMPAVSLIFNFFALFAFWLVDTAGGWIASYAQAAEGEAASRPWLSYISYLSPSAYSTNLVHPHLAPFAVSVSAYAVFAAVFLLAGYAALRARDL